MPALTKPKKTAPRKRKPKQLAVINESCTGCSGSPVCIELCPIADCMFLVQDEDAPVFGVIKIDHTVCIGCKKCTSQGPMGVYLEGCPWDAIDMVALEDFETDFGDLDNLHPNIPEAILKS